MKGVEVDSKKLDRGESSKRKSTAEESLWVKFKYVACYVVF